MKIEFDDGGYVEFVNSKDGNIFVIVAAKNEDRTKTINSAEISAEQLDQLLSDIQMDELKHKEEQ